MTLEVVKEVVQGINSFSGSDANKSGTFRLAYKIVSRLNEALPGAEASFYSVLQVTWSYKGKKALPFPQLSITQGAKTLIISTSAKVI